MRRLTGATGTELLDNVGNKYLSLDDMTLAGFLFLD